MWLYQKSQSMAERLTMRFRRRQSLILLFLFNMGLAYFAVKWILKPWVSKYDPDLLGHCTATVRMTIISLKWESDNFWLFIQISIGKTFDNFSNAFLEERLFTAENRLTFCILYLHLQLWIGKIELDH